MSLNSTKLNTEYQMLLMLLNILLLLGHGSLPLMEAPLIQPAELKQPKLTLVILIGVYIKQDSHMLL